MKTCLLALFLLSWFCACQSRAQENPQDTLPDNHLQFTLHKSDGRFVGASKYLEGFRISMDISHELLGDGLDIDTLISLVKNQGITGTLTYPNGKTSQIEYEVVQHRSTEAIYMKTTLGYFLWESITLQDDQLVFVINWWYCPPAREVDFETLDMTEQLLADSTNWHKNDDRKCDIDIESNQWSLFCALKYASIEKMGEYNHHNTAMQAVRLAIDSVVPNHQFEHTLMDYNNSPTTGHENILHIIEIAKNRIVQDIMNTDK